MASLPAVGVVQLTQCGLDQRTNSARRYSWAAQQTNGRGQYSRIQSFRRSVQQTGCDVHDAQGDHNAVRDCVTHAVIAGQRASATTTPPATPSLENEGHLVMQVQ